MSTNKINAIWYIPQFKEWAIGSAWEIGTNWRRISSNGQSEWDCPHLVPNGTWDYYPTYPWNAPDPNNWVAANSGDILVECTIGKERLESKIMIIKE